MSQSVSRPPDLVGCLFHFGLTTVLPAAPAGLWWTLGMGLFSGLNLLFQQEIWRHTPGIDSWFWFLGLACLLVLPWQVGRTAYRVADSVHSWFWRFCWRLAAGSAYAAGAVGLIPAIICFVWWLTSKLL